MILISHRGNTDGPNLITENLPSHIQILLNEKIHIEIDVWKIKEQFFLGHDTPCYEIDYNFLHHNNLWCHAKNLEALYTMMQMKVHCFWHQTDDFTLTSNGIIWTYPNKNITPYSVIVDLNKNYNIGECYGICSDYIV